MSHQNLGTLAEAQAKLPRPISRTTFSAWVKRGWIRAYRIGGRTLYDLDSVAAIVVPIPKLSEEERAAIAELVVDSPDPSDEQIAKVRSIIHGASTG